MVIRDRCMHCRGTSVEEVTCVRLFVFRLRNDRRKLVEDIMRQPISQPEVLGALIEAEEDALDMRGFEARHCERGTDSGTITIIPNKWKEDLADWHAETVHRDLSRRKYSETPPWSFCGVSAHPLSLK